MIPSRTTAAPVCFPFFPYQFTFKDRGHLSPSLRHLGDAPDCRRRIEATACAAGDMKAAAMLLRLMLALADIQVIETSPERDQRWAESMIRDGS
jgi:hypothetical protein